MCLQKTTVSNVLSKDAGSQSNWQNGSSNSALEVQTRSHGCSCAGSSTWRGEDKMNQFDGLNTLSGVQAGLRKLKTARSWSTSLTKTG